MVEEGALKIFVSHAHEDAAVARALVKLFRVALHLEHGAILCTSVDGYGLPPGADTDEVLREKIREATTFVGLLSPHAFASTYVLTEIGARWGAKRDLTPLLAPGVDSSIIKGPIAGKHALRAGNRSDLHRLLEHLAYTMGERLHSPSVFVEELEALASMQSSSSTKDHLRRMMSPAWGPPEPSEPSPVNKISPESPQQIDIALKAVNAALVVAVTNHSPETIRNMPLLVTDIKLKFGQHYVEAEEFHRDGQFPIYSLGRVTLFPKHEHTRTFAEGGNPACLDFPGTRIDPKQPSNLKLKRGGEWRVSFRLELGNERTKDQDRLFSWAPGNKPLAVD